MVRLTHDAALESLNQVTYLTRLIVVALPDYEAEQPAGYKESGAEEGGGCRESPTPGGCRESPTPAGG